MNLKIFLVISFSILIGISLRKYYERDYKIKKRGEKMEKEKRTKEAIKTLAECLAKKERNFSKKIYQGEYYNEIDLRFILDEYDNNNLLEKIEFFERDGILKKVNLLRSKKRLDFFQEISQDELMLIGRVLKLGDINFLNITLSANFGKF